MSVALRGARIAWDCAGATTAPPLVWGHGLTSSRADEDRFPYVDLHRVRDHATVIRYDAHGHGESSSLSEPERGGWHELARDQIALIDYLGIDRVILGGASMGTGTALHAALELRERVQALLLVIPPTGWAERAAQVSLYDTMATIVERKGVEPLVEARAKVAPPDPFVGNTAYADHSAQRLRSFDVDRLAAVLRGAGHAQLPEPERLATLDMPTLVLAWSGDTGHPISTAERLGELLPDSRVVVSSTAAELATWTDRVIEFVSSLVR